jgi:hypothetical protein
MAELIYVACALTSSFCAILLIRNYGRTRLRLAFLASLCFSGLALNNLLLLVERVVTPAIDLSVARGAVALVAMLFLVAGLVLEDS